MAIRFHIPQQFICFIVSLILPCLLLFAPSSLFSAQPAKKTPFTSSPTSSFSSTIAFTAQDSVLYDADKQTMSLWGKAVMKDSATTLTAPKMVIDLPASRLTAYGEPSSATIPAQPASFYDPKGSFTSSAITYDFKSRKGTTTALASTYNGLQVSGKNVERLDNGELKITDATFTTCLEEEPHYWFKSSTMTITPEGKVTAKPLYMYMRPELFSTRLPTVPLLALPYMKFSTKPSRASGLLLPSVSRFDNSNALSGMGYYWAMNEYADIRSEGDIAQNGSWRIGERLRYRQRDRFSSEVQGELKQYRDANEWNGRIVHNHRFNATSQLDANLAFSGGERRYEVNTIDSQTLVSEQTSMYASMAKSFADNKALAALTLNGWQDLRNDNGVTNLTLSYYQQPLFLSQPPATYNDEAWRISGYALLKNNQTNWAGNENNGYLLTTAVTTDYFTGLKGKSHLLLRQGIVVQTEKNSVDPTALPYERTTLLLPLQAHANLLEHLFLQSEISAIQTLATDKRDNDYGTVLWKNSATTRLYGTLATPALTPLFGLTALRHTFIPEISFSWNPHFAAPLTNNNAINNYVWPFDTPFTIGTTPYFGALPDGQSRIGLTLKNLLHGKFRSTTDSVSNGAPSTTDKSVALLSLNVATALNTATDDFRWQPLTITASSNALAPPLFISGGAMYDFYSFDAVTGNRIPERHSENGGNALRFVKGYANISVAMQGKRLGNEVAPMQPVVGRTEQALFADRFRMSGFSTIDYSLPWQAALSLYSETDKSNPLQPYVTTLLHSSVRMALSPTWQASIATGYDFQRQTLAFPVVQAYHDLHCWQMGMQWIPSGEFKGYGLSIGLKNFPTF